MTNSLSKNLNFLPISFQREFTMKNLLVLTGGSLIGFACFYLGKIWYSYKFFEKMKIKTPCFRFLYGNLHEIMKNVILFFLQFNSKILILFYALILELFRYIEKLDFESKFSNLRVNLKT